MRLLNPYSVGLLAGIAAGLMVLAGLRAGSASLVLLFAAPAAVYVASLGWGTVAGIIAALIASAIASYDGGFQGAIFAATLLFAPAAWAGHLTNLGQPDASGQGMIWYPLPDILIRLMLAIFAGFVITATAFGYNSEAIAKGLVDVFGEFFDQSPELQKPAPERMAEIAGLYASLLPLVLPALWLLLHVLVFYLSAVVTRLSGQMARANWDVPAEAGLPRFALTLPAAGMAAMLTGASPVYEIGAVAMGIAIAGFGLVGLAELHLSARNRPGRGFIIFVVWLLIFLFSLPIIIFAVTGAFRVWRLGSNTPPTGGANQT